MPSFASPAHSQPQSIPVRVPNEGELYVINSYKHHTGHCSDCADPVSTVRNGRSLCSRGRRHVEDMASWLTFRDGHVYSVPSKLNNHQCHEIEIPLRYKVVSDLARAIDYAQRASKAKRVVVHNDNNDDLTSGQNRPSTPTSVHSTSSAADPQRVQTIRVTNRAQTPSSPRHGRNSSLGSNVSVSSNASSHKSPYRTPGNYLQ